MPDKARPHVFGTDQKPRRSKDLRKRPKIATPTDDADRGKSLSQEPLDLDFDDWIAALLVSAHLWQRVEDFENRERQELKAGRKRTHSVCEAMLVTDCLKLGISERQIFRMLKKGYRRRRLRKILKKAWPDHPNRRLPKRPMSRSQGRYFRDKYLADHDTEHESYCRSHRKQAVEMAVFSGMAKPRDGSLNRPKPSRLLIGDLSWVVERYDRRNIRDKNSPQICLDALPYNGKEPTYRGTRGYNIVIIWIRNPYYGERVALDVGVKPADMSESEYFVWRVGLLLEENPELRHGVLGTVYDMAVHGKRVDELFDIGLVHVGKVPDTNTGEPQSGKLLDEEFICKDGSTITTDVHLNDGTASLAYVSGDGEYEQQPLRQIDLYKRPNEDGTWRWYGEFEVPDGTHMGELAGATTTIRMDSTADERAGLAKRRTSALRAYPESDPRFRSLFGPRETAESGFRTYKSTLDDGRAPCVTNRRMMLDLAAFQTVEAMKALFFYSQRTGADLSRWFGNYDPLARDRPLAAGA